MFGTLASTLLNATRQVAPMFLQRQLHAVSQGYITNSLCAPGIKNTVTGGSWALIPVRNNVRNHFPYPKEQQRIKRHGYWKRISSLGGRKILMRRILKGRHVLSH